jgi:16S rRNA (cytidine1402-2'-O)-methyltransferase
VAGGRPGTLFVVATPIGNLADASPRLVETLGRCGLVLCEDTRRTGLLVQRLGVPPRRLLTCHEHDERQRVPHVLDALRAGTDVALVSDAGTPTLSDPGHRLVAAAIEAGLPVSPVPGPSAVTAALSVCGLPTDSFAFEGFPPRKRAARARWLAALADEPRTLVIYESPHRLAETLVALAEAFGGARRAFLGRELTKLHEELAHGTLAELAARFAAAAVKGEVVLVVAGARGSPDGAGAGEVRARVAELVAEGLPEKDALRTAAREAGLTRRDVYRLVKLAPDPSEDEEKGSDPSCLSG